VIFFLNQQNPWISRQALHAHALEVIHPVSKELLLLKAALPSDMLKAMENLGIDMPDAIDDIFQQYI